MLNLKNLAVHFFLNRLLIHACDKLMMRLGTNYVTIALRAVVTDLAVLEPLKMLHTSSGPNWSLIKLEFSPDNR